MDRRKFANRKCMVFAHSKFRKIIWKVNVCFLRVGLGVYTVAFLEAKNNYPVKMSFKALLRILYFEKFTSYNFER